jgi:hypothetical protein
MIIRSELKPFELPNLSTSKNGHTHHVLGRSRRAGSVAASRVRSLPARGRAATDSREAAPLSCTGTTHRGSGIAMLICAVAMTLCGNRQAGAAAVCNPQCPAPHGETQGGRWPRAVHGRRGLRFFTRGARLPIRDGQEPRRPQVHRPLYAALSPHTAPCQVLCLMGACACGERQTAHCLIRSASACAM